MSGTFYEEGSKFLTPSAFEFVLESEMKRAVRRQNYVTLVLVEASREWEGVSLAADEGTVREVGQVLGKEIRDTDLLGHAGKGALAVVLLDADFDQSATVIDRPDDPYRGLRLPDHASDCSRGRLLPHACRGCRFIEAGGELAGGREPAPRDSLVAAQNRGRIIMRFRAIVLCLTAAAIAVFGHPTMLAGQDVSPGSTAIAPSVNTKSSPTRRGPLRDGPPPWPRYRIGNGDKLRIEVYKDQQLSQSVQVRPDGRITPPLIGDLDAADADAGRVARLDYRGAQGLRDQSHRHGHRRCKRRRRSWTWWERSTIRAPSHFKVDR